MKRGFALIGTDAGVTVILTPLSAHQIGSGSYGALLHIRSSGATRHGSFFQRLSSLVMHLVVHLEAENSHKRLRGACVSPGKEALCKPAYG